MTFGTRRKFYRVRNNAYGWAKLVFAATVIGFLMLRVMARL